MKGRRETWKFKSFECIELIVKSGTINIRICTLYRPPSGSKYGLPVSVFLREIHEYMDSLSSCTDKLIVVGDINIPLDVKSDPNTKKFENILYSLNLEQHVKSTTHQQGHILDVVITRINQDNPSDLQVHPPDFTDHYPVTFSLNSSVIVPVKKTITYRKLKDINTHEFKSDIVQSDLVNGPKQDIDSLVEQYNTILSNLLDKHAPRITKQVSERKKTPWFKEEFQTAKAKRRKAERQWIKNQSVINLEIIRAERKAVNNAVKRAKRNYFQQEIETHHTNPKQLYKIINILLKKKESLLPEGEDKDLVEKFISFFSNKIKKITDTFTPVTNRDYVTHNILPAGELKSFSSISAEDLSKQIRTGNSKSCHLDPIPTWLVKECLDVLVSTITKIVNTSPSSCVMPDIFKTATVTPLLKKKGLNVEEYKNYRPVSNLPFLSKLTEKVVVEQLNDHMNNNSLVEKNQSAYRKHHSTETALLKTTNDILCAIDQSQCVLLIMLDQSAAFDTVNQDELLHQLEFKYGITDLALKWLQSYFKGRSQAVTLGEASSTPHKLVTGFPQGSVLGPFSYPVYTAPLFDIARSHDIPMYMYADDTQLMISFDPDNYAIAFEQMNSCINDIRKWMKEKHLKLNEEKTEVMLIGTKASLAKSKKIDSMKIGDEFVDVRKTATNIGVTFDATMSFSNHISNITKKCYFHLFLISKIRPFLTEKVANKLVCSLILSRLDYANSVLYGLPEAELHRLQMVQNNAARVVMRKRKMDHVTPLLKHLHWLPVKKRIEYKILLLTFKALHGEAPSYIQEMLHPYIPSRTLRSADKLQLIEKRMTRKHGDRAFSAAAPKLWNALPLPLRLSKNSRSFKKTLKTHLFNCSFG